jgi:hypothetical protein
MIQSLTLLFIFILPTYSQVIPNLDEFQEIYLMTAMSSSIEKDQELLKAIEQVQEESCEDDGSYTGPEKIVTKEKPSISFYTKITGPVEDIKVMDLSTTLNNKFDENISQLSNVIKAQDESSRIAAIKNVCAGKTSIEKIGFGSSLFYALGQVYNNSLAGGGADQFSAIDKTKNPNETQNITLQRQYNSLNRKFLNGSSDFPPMGGVCRHASTLVADFLTQCGLDAKDIQQVGYTTFSSAHATVKVTDPASGKTYFLNWGELKALDNSSGLSNFDVPSNSYGMIIGYYSPDEEGKRIGSSRTNKGVVMARLLHIADNEIDITHYRTTEAGMTIDLGKKTIVKVKSDNWKEVEQKIKLGYISADNYINTENPDFQGTDQSMLGASAAYARDARKHYGDHLYWDNRLQSSVGMASSKDGSFNTQIIGGLTHKQGMSIGYISGEKTKTTVELGADAVAEVYAIESSQTGFYPGNYTKKGQSFDGQGYVVARVKLRNENDKRAFETNASTRATGFEEMQYNHYKIPVNFTAYNPQLSLLYLQKFSKDKAAGVTMTYVGSFDRNFVRTEGVYTDGKNKLSASSGFTVMKTRDGKNFIYSVATLRKDIELKSLDVGTSLNVQKSLTTPSPVIVTGTVVITPKLRKKR